MGMRLARGVLPLVILVVFFEHNVLAADGYFSRSGEKLGRGVTNIAFSGVEIPKALEDGIQKDEPVKLILVHPTRGVCSTLKRILVGAYEVVTFWIPQRPIVKPAYIMPNIKEYLKQRGEPNADVPGG